MRYGFKVLGFNGHQARVSIKPGRVSRYQEKAVRHSSTPRRTFAELIS
jgi:hypothetical protein